VRVVTEPRAVATGPLIVEEVTTRQPAGRYRSRFCNDRLLFLRPTLTFNYTGAVESERAYRCLRWWWWVYEEKCRPSLQLAREGRPRLWRLS